MSDLLIKMLAERDYLMADGAIGTNLFAMGLEAGDSPEIWNADKPEKIRALHDSFVEAGADLLTTNTFGANSYRLKLHNAQDRAHELNYEGVRIARAAADAVDRPVAVAASMGPTGEIFEPVGTVSIEEGEAAFREQAIAQAEAGADVHWIETISGREELTAAIRGASVTGLPVVSTMTFDTVGRTMMGLTPEDGVALKDSLSDELVAAGKASVLAFGANCGVGPGQLVDSVLSISQGGTDSQIIVAKGNCGIPEYQDGAIVYSGTPEIMADYARMARDAGARIIGGCCGTTATHVKAMVDALNGYTPGDKPSKEAIEAALGPIAPPPPTEGLGGREGRRRRRAS
ncbi:MAG: betaine--homocysteine S-methyltransferase [Rhodospirillales bacterium]|nr:betaine--homocysteine S-methyltransferase [Rhodospirillales bacterium]MBT5519925.1 betaine--homocysteine S-methyltransferase [Rhodospirillales bacterium]MBT7147303.1 betaine--homocysteine S-methyltransferase [Rhodospirillales bacterium]